MITKHFKILVCSGESFAAMRKALGQLAYQPRMERGFVVTKGEPSFIEGRYIYMKSARLKQRVAELERERNDRRDNAGVLADAASSYEEASRTMTKELEAARKVIEAVQKLHPGAIYIGRECCFGTWSGHELGHAKREDIEAFNAALAAHHQATQNQEQRDEKAE